MKRWKSMKIIQAALAWVAILFGLVTIAAGARVLAGADPGYVVFRPLLIYNTAMGAAYVAAGIVMWRSPAQGRQAAATVFSLNLIALGAVSYLSAAGGAVAIDSVRAMVFRTAVWLVLFLGLRWMCRSNSRSGAEGHAGAGIPPGRAG